MVYEKENIDFKSLVETALKEGIEGFIVGAVIIKDNKVLLLERPKDDFMPGIFELPSGKVEKNESLKEALLREVLEETNLKVKSIKEYLGSFDYLSNSKKKKRQFNFLVEVEDFNIKLSEHDSYKFLSINELEDYNITSSVKSIIKKVL